MSREDRESGIAGGTLEWTQRKWSKRFWELRLGERVVARMSPRRWYGSDLRIEMGAVDERAPRSTSAPRHGASDPANGWAVRQRWSGAVELRAVSGADWPADTREPLVTFQPRLLGRGVVRIGADEFSWRRRFHAFRLDSFELLNASDFPLLRIERRWAPLRVGGSITTDDTGRRHPRIEGLLMLSWALAVMSSREASH